MSAIVNPLPRPAAGRAAAVRRPRVGVVKFASCDGCQLTLLDLEDELLAITEQFDIVEFAEATSNRSQGPFDVLLVEGSISTPEQARGDRPAAARGDHPGHHRRLRDERWHPGAAQPGRP